MPSARPPGENDGSCAASISLPCDKPNVVDREAVKHLRWGRSVLNYSEELELIGWRDYLTPDALWLIEWPEKAAKALPPLDIGCYLQFESEGRQLKLEAATAKGGSIIDKLVTL